MPSTTQDYSQIKEYQEKATSLSREAAGLESTAFTLPDTIMKAVQEDRIARGVSKLATDTGNIMGQMVSDPNAIREGSTSLSSQGLVDPFSINELTSNARKQNIATLGTVSTQLEQNQGSLDQVIQAGANQLKARAATLLAQAEQATAQANALQSEWERMFKEKQAAADEAYRYAALNDTGVGSTIPSMQPTTPTTPSPNYSPISGEGSVSKDGQWVYINKKWEPLGGTTPVNTGYTLNQINNAIQQAASSGNTKAVTMWKGVLASTIATQKAQEPTKASALAQRDANNAASGLTQISNIKTWVTEDPDLITRVQTPVFGNMGTAGKMRKALKEVQDIYTRLRTGAALNSEEIAFYESQIAPNLINIADPTSFNYGLELAESFFAGIAGKNTASNNQSLESILGD